MQELIEAAKAVLATADEFGSTPNLALSAAQGHALGKPIHALRSALSNAETHLPPAPGSLALGAVPEGGEERGAG